MGVNANHLNTLLVLQKVRITQLVADETGPLAQLTGTPALLTAAVNTNQAPVSQITKQGRESGT